MTNEEAMEMLVSVIGRITQKLREVIDDIPPYLWFELCHPKKKPRGSMRRKRQGRESK